MVLYWMTSARRVRANFGLERAAELARDLGKPLVVLEALRVDHRWAAPRFHQFVLDGMRDNAAALTGRRGVTYHAYLEPAAGDGKGLLTALGSCAAAIVTDDFPSFFLPAMTEAAGARLDVRLEAVDSNGLFPLRAFDRAFPSAYVFRRAWQKEAARHLSQRPDPDPPSPAPGVPAWQIPDAIAARWPDLTDWEARGGTLAALALDPRVGPVSTRGGAAAGRERLNAFVADDLPVYGDARNQPDEDRSSGLSAYLHWGHLGAHEVLDRVIAREGWLGHLPPRATGMRAGWWGMSAGAESFLDELVTWRELGYNMCAQQPGDYDRYESLPGWARASLDRHADDPRDPVYDIDALERSRTYDPLWNAAQRQLVREGRMHNYLRMLWGKKILQWSATPQEALATMIQLNNKYALDGRNPNSYSGIFWVLGRYDRPWAPERPIFGVIRYMSSENTAKKLRVKRYLDRYGPAAAEEQAGRLF